MLAAVRMVFCHLCVRRPGPMQARPERARRHLVRDLRPYVWASPTTYAGDRLLTSVGAADGDGHAEPGRTGRRDCRAAATQSGTYDDVVVRARSGDGSRRYL
jgi:hypothetical protein